VPGHDVPTRRDALKGREDPPGHGTPGHGPPDGRGDDVPEVDAVAADVFAGMGAFGAGGPPVVKPDSGGRGPAATPLGRLAALEATVVALTLRVDAIAPIHVPPGPSDPPGPPDRKALAGLPAGPLGSHFSEAAIAAAAGPFEVDPLADDDDPPWEGADAVEVAAFNVLRNLQAQGWQVQLVPPDPEV
jgi:hypothetical protein